MWKTIRNLIIAVVIIGAGAGAGWLIATLTNPYSTPTPIAAATSTAAPANRTVTGGTPAAGTTPAASTPNASGTPAGTTPGATTGAGQQTGGQGQTGTRTQVAQVTGKVQSYDASAKKLTVTTDQGVRTLNVTSSRFTKSISFKSDELSQFATSPLLVTGERAADGTITARTITAVEMGAGQGQFFGGGGQAGGAGQTGGGQAGGAGQGAGQGAGGNRAGLGQGGTILVSSSFKDGILTGQTFQGESVKVAINGDTKLLKQAAAAETDLKEGAEVTATLRPNSGDASEAVTVVING